MERDAFTQAKIAGPLKRWGQILGTGCRTLPQRAYAIEATKKAMLLAFSQVL
jgi:hypothetical protein